MSIFYDLMFVGMFLMTVINTAILLSNDKKDLSKLNASAETTPIIKPGTRTTFGVFS